MTILESKILKHKNINILKEKTDKNFNYKNELLNDIQFRKIEDCINEILKGGQKQWN